MKAGVHELTSEFDKDMGNPLRQVGVEDYNYYLKNNFDYAIVNSEAYSKFFKKNEMSRNFPSLARFYHELFKKGKLIKEFNNENGNVPGPIVKVFKFE